MSRGRRFAPAGVAAALLAPLALLAPRAARAQACDAAGVPGACAVPTSASITAGTVVRLSISRTLTTLVAPAARDYDRGFAAGAGATLTIQANAPWVVAASAQTAAWVAAGPAARTDKPSTDLLLGTTQSSTFAPLATTPSTLASGGATAGRVEQLLYRVLWDYARDTPGDYSLTVQFTVTVP